MPYVCTPFIYLYTPSSVYLYTLCISVDHTFHVAHSRGEKCADPGGSGQIDPDCGLPAVGAGAGWSTPLTPGQYPGGQTNGCLDRYIPPPPPPHTHTTLLHLGGGTGPIAGHRSTYSQHYNMVKRCSAFLKRETRQLDIVKGLSGVDLGILPGGGGSGRNSSRGG